MRSLRQFGTAKAEFGEAKEQMVKRFIVEIIVNINEEEHVEGVGTCAQIGQLPKG